MVEKVIHKTKTVSKILFAISALSLVALPVSAANTSSQNVNFEVTVNERLAVSLETPDASSWATGDTGDLLVNQLILTVSSNNASGFLASMTTEDEGTALINTDSSSKSTIPTLTNAYTTSAFPAGYWGYSLDNSTYQAVAAANATPNKILSRSGPAVDASQAIYFGAMASVSQDAGTYAKTVVFKVVSGVNETITNPTDPIDNPDKPVDTKTNNPAKEYRSSTGNTTYTGTTTSNGTTTTISEVYTGNTTTNGYAGPQGVTTTEISEGNSLATGLAVTAAVAAASGIVFFIIAKRRKDEDEEEEEL